jgi:hypothetical protein
MEFGDEVRESDKLESELCAILYSQVNDRLKTE